MSSVNCITGKSGEIQVGATTVARITSWDVNPTLATSSEWGDSDSAGYTNRLRGRLDATFNAAGKYDTASEPWSLIYVGVVADVTLWINGTKYFNFPRALCNDFNMTIDIDSAEVVGYESSWGADGMYYRPGQAGAPVKRITDSSQS